MRVFVTGASGMIGSVVVKELLTEGYQVLGLPRSDKSAAKLIAAGAEVHRGTIQDLESLKTGASQCDGVIHVAFITDDFNDYAGSCKIDQAAISTIGDTLAGSNRPFVVTSGILLLTPGDVRTENDSADPKSAGGPRAVSEEVALSYAAKGVRISIVRLSPSVHGEADYKGFIPMLIAKARENKVSMYIGEGKNRWTAVHVLDAARLYRLALEKGKAGSKFHAVADESVYFRDIVGVIGKKLGVPVVSKSFEEMFESLAWLAYPFSGDGPASSRITREQLGWVPRERGLIEDIEAGFYFKQ